LWDLPSILTVLLFHLGIVRGKGIIINNDKEDAAKADADREE
jgi:hypothetical protein